MSVLPEQTGIVGRIPTNGTDVLKDEDYGSNLVMNTLLMFQSSVFRVYHSVDTGNGGYIGVRSAEWAQS